MEAFLWHGIIKQPHKCFAFQRNFEMRVGNNVNNHNKVTLKVLSNI